MNPQNTTPATSSKPGEQQVELTSKGQPRQRAPGGGRKNAGRPERLNARVSIACNDQLLAIQEQLGLKTFVEAIEYAAQVAFEKIPKKQAK